MRRTTGAVPESVRACSYGADAALDPLERIFFYMPLQHAESPDVQDESVAAFRRLLDEAPPELRMTFHEAYTGRRASPRSHRPIRPLPAPQRRPGPRQH